MTTWIDTKTDIGFTREFDKTKYYYNKNNVLFNCETSYNQPKFLTYKQETSLNDKIGTIDFETYGSNLGLGHHQVYAAGYAINGKTDLHCIEQSETSEGLINRFLLKSFNKR